MIPLILQTALGQRESISVFGDDYETPDGTCIRDYIHVSDLADAHMRAVDYLINGGDSNVFNLGNGQGFSVTEVIAKVREVTGRDFTVVTSPRRAGDPAILIASSDKARTVLGWNPSRDKLDDIIRSAWEWHLHHPNGYDD
ncbi:UDP-glucose 4-epimerase [compost metagenome]